VLRDARRGDAADIHALLSELADYERLSHEVTGTPEDLDRHLFGERPYAYAILAHVDGALAGFALYFFTYSTFLCRPGLWLEDLFVRPAFRRLGIGRRLLAELARRAVDEGCGRVEWAVLDWNAPSIEFYRGLGARPQDEWTTFRLTGEALTRLAADGNAGSASPAPSPSA
jgi:GNAT superfamily N-acetyltransferase